jgi:sugar diacid utilization regulator
VPDGTPYRWRSGADCRDAAQPDAWRDSGGSNEQAAAWLFCRPNTVRHRLRRITEATDCTFTAPQDLAELCLALEAARQQSG